MATIFRRNLQMHFPDWKCITFADDFPKGLINNVLALVLRMVENGWSTGASRITLVSEMGHHWIFDSGNGVLCVNIISIPTKTYFNTKPSKCGSNNLSNRTINKIFIKTDIPKSLPAVKLLLVQRMAWHRSATNRCSGRRSPDPVSLVNFTLL